MKRPTPQKADSSVTRQGAQIIAPGGFPVKQNTVTADVLARLLAGERLTSLDTVYEASTTRLGAVVFYLAHEYGWPIHSIDKAAGCNDGRVAWVSEYYMPAEVIDAAMAVGAGEWCGKVRAARWKRGAHAAQARREASRVNASLYPTAQQFSNAAGLFSNALKVRHNDCHELNELIKTEDVSFNLAIEVARFDHARQRFILAEFPTIKPRYRAGFVELVRTAHEQEHAHA